MKRCIPMVLLAAVLLSSCAKIDDSVRRQPAFLSTLSGGLINLDKVQCFKIVQHDLKKDGDEEWVVRAYFSVSGNEYIDFDSRKEQWIAMVEYEKLAAALNTVHKVARLTPVKGPASDKASQ